MVCSIRQQKLALDGRNCEICRRLRMLGWCVDVADWTTRWAGKLCAGAGAMDAGIARLLASQRD